MKNILPLTFLIMNMYSLSAQPGLRNSYLEVMHYFRANKPDYDPQESYNEDDLVVQFSGNTAAKHHELYTYFFTKEDSCYVFAITTDRSQYKKQREKFRTDEDFVPLKKDKWISRKDGSTWLIAHFEDVIHIVNLYEE